jgi:hypothetical protein
MHTDQKMVKCTSLETVYKMTRRMENIRTGMYNIRNLRLSDQISGSSVTGWIQYYSWNSNGEVRVEPVFSITRGSHRGGAPIDQNS